jgi:hypothetical protein
MVRRARPVVAAVVVAAVVVASLAAGPAKAFEWDFSGTWVPETGQAACGIPGHPGPRFVVSDLVMRIEGDHPLAGSSCVVEASRGLTPARAYLDLACVRGAERFSLPLDINRLDQNRLMVAERPLGSAQIVVRCLMMRG